MTLDDDSAILTLPPSPPESLAPGNLGLSPSSSPPPILLRFPLHRRSRGILHLEPIGRAAGTIGKVLPLRDDTFEVTRLAYDPRYYWLPPRKSLPNREALALRIGLRPFRQVADTWPLGPADNQPNPCSAFLNLFDRLGRRDNGLPGHEPHQQSPASQRHKVRGLLIPLTRNFSIESRVSPASAGLFERGFISRGARNTRRQKFSSVVRAPSGTSFIHEAAIDGKIFTRHPPCRKPLLKASPDGTAREPR